VAYAAKKSAQLQWQDHANRWERPVNRDQSVTASRIDRRRHSEYSEAGESERASRSGILQKIIGAIAAFCLMSATSAMAAPTADERTWSLGGDERDPYLTFGNPEMGETTVLLICNNRKKIAELSVNDASKGAKAGQAVKIELAAGTNKASFSGKTVRSAGVYGYARKIDFQTVAAMFRAPGTITVTMGENRYMLHDKGRAKAVGALINVCKLK
jgi:hypothetical protein